MENVENCAVLNGNESSGESDYSGFCSDDQQSDISVPAWSDFSDASSVDSLHTADLTDWELEAPDQDASSTCISY